MAEDPALLRIDGFSVKNFSKDLLTLLQTCLYIDAFSIGKNKIFNDISVSFIL